MATEKRLIDANELVAYCKRTKVIEVFPNWKDMSALEHAAVIRFATKYREIILSAPIVDAVEVVRCKDCKFYDGKDEVCEAFKQTEDISLCTIPSGYCHLAERKDND